MPPTEFALDTQIASQARAVAEVLSDTEAPRLDPNRPIVFTGIGTSLHACRIAAWWLADLTAGRIRAVAVNAHELALHEPLSSEDQVVVVSHRGTKRFPNEVLAKARQLGAATVAVTGRGPARPEADAVLRTCAQEAAGTHTVSYVTALAALAKLVAGVSASAGNVFLTELESVPAAIEATLALPAPTGVAASLASTEPVLLTGYGSDAITAAEAALKIKEGTYLWAEGMSVEFALHGTPAVYDPRMAALLILPDTDEEDGRRSVELRRLLDQLSVRSYTCSSRADADLPFRGVPRLLRPFVAIVPLQRLVAELARIRGTNPDTIHAEAEPWARAMGSVTL